jgi:HSP20 family protein
MLPRHAIVRDPERLAATVVGTTRKAGCRLETYRDGETFHIDIDLPGVDPADVDVTTDRDVLTVRASRHAGQAKALGGKCQIPLSGALDTDRLAARYDDGVLTVSIPVRAAAQDLPLAA